VFLTNFVSLVCASRLPLFNPNAQKAAARESLTKRYQHLSEVLGDKPYLFGETFLVPDAYLFTVTTWAKLHNFDLSPWPNLQQYQARVAARPAVQKALKKEGLI